MAYGLALTTGPTTEPVSLDLLKLHCRVNGDTENELLDHYRTAARQLFESMTDTAVMPQTWKLYVDEWHPLQWWHPLYPITNAPELNAHRRTLYVPKAPLVSVSSITYWDANDAQQTLSSTTYAVNTTTRPGRIVWIPSFTYPVLSLNKAPRITVTFTCGYSSVNTVPALIRQAIFAQAASWYENRESYISDRFVNDGFRNVCDQYRCAMTQDLNDKGRYAFDNRNW